MSLTDPFSTQDPRSFPRGFTSYYPFRTGLNALDEILTDLCQPYAGPHFYPTEDGLAYSLTLELAGYKKEHVTVEVDSSHRLIVHASRPTGKVNDVEMASTTHCPRVLLPVDTDDSKVEAKLEDGLLTVIIQKSPEAKPRKVTVS